VSAPQRISLTVATFLVMAVAISMLALKGYNPWIAVVTGVWWGLVPVGLLFGVLNLMAPVLVIRWRERAMVGNVGYRKVVGDWFSRRLGAAGPRPWESQTARYRVRMLGLAQTAFWAIALAFLIWSPYFVDRLIR
jgi:hypothetical protein